MCWTDGQNNPQKSQICYYIIIIQTESSLLQHVLIWHLWRSCKYVDTSRRTRSAFYHQVLVIANSTSKNEWTTIGEVDKIEQNFVESLVYYCFLVFRRIGEYISLDLFYWVVQVGLLTPLTFVQHRLAAFTSGAYGRRWQWICEFYTANFKGIFGGR